MRSFSECITANFYMFTVFYKLLIFAFSALTLLVGYQEEHLTHKKS